MDPHISAALRACGIPAFGVCSFADVQPTLPCRAQERLPVNAQSVIVCLFPYYVEAPQERNLARYAIVADYHKVAGGMLQEATERLRGMFSTFHFEPFADSSPIREVEAGYLAGLGFIGKNGQLITPEYGSYCFIGEAVTDLALPPSKPSTQTCEGCLKCIGACPTRAIGAKGSISIEHCRSHVTQKKGELTAWEEKTILQGGLAWGCDVCTDICPYNKNPRPTPITAFSADILPLITEGDCRWLCRQRAFGFRGAGVPQRNLRILAQGEAAK